MATDSMSIRQLSEQAVRDLKPGDHLCCIYETDKEHRCVLAPFLSQGLHLGQKVIYIVDDRTAEDILTYLRDAGVDTDQYLASGQLQVLSAAEAYTREGIFDPARMISLLEQETQRAAAEGYSALRVTGEMTWALRGTPGSHRLIEYESRLNDFFSHHNCLAICQYDRRRFDPEVLLEVLTTHPKALVRGQLFDNFYYIPPRDLLGDDPLKARLDNWLRSLEARQRAEEALRKAHEELGRRRALTVAGSLDGLWEWNTASRVVQCSPRLAELLGYDPHEIPNTIDFFDQAVHPDDRAAMWAAVRRHLEDRAPYDIELRFRTKQGLYRWFRARGQAEWDEAGRATWMAGSLHDITARKEEESERAVTIRLLSQANTADSLRQLVRHITALLQEWSEFQAVGIRLRDGDDYPYYETRGFPADFVEAENRLCVTKPDGTLLRNADGNPVLECLCGSVLQCRFDRRLACFTDQGSFWTNSTTDLLAPMMQTDREGRIRNRCGRQGYESLALVPLRTMGETFGLIQFNDRRRNMLSPALMTRFERLAATVAAAIAQRRAVDAMKQSEEMLRQQRQSLAEAQRIAHLGNWDWDILTNQLHWSDEVYRIFGLRPRQFGATYEAFLDRVHPDDREAVDQAVRRSLANQGAGYSIHHRVVRPDGTVRIVHERAEVTFNDEGKPVRMIGTVHDVTEQRLAEAESRRLRAELTHRDRVGTISALTAALAHEINQPLAGILSNAQAALRLLAASRPDLDEVREAIEDIVADDKRAAEVISRLRAMLKREETAHEAFDLNATIQEVQRLVHSEFVLRNVVLEMDLADRLPPVLGDRVQIQQVLLNLLMNAVDAVQHCAAGARRVNVSSRLDAGNGPVVTVTDSGAGVAPEKLETIFHPFQTTKPNGLGIGLALCQSIIQAHGGRLWATNLPNGGAAFHFTLPASPAKTPSGGPV